MKEGKNQLKKRRDGQKRVTKLKDGELNVRVEIIKEKQRWAKKSDKIKRWGIKYQSRDNSKSQLEREVSEKSMRMTSHSLNYLNQAMSLQVSVVSIRLATYEARPEP